MKTKIYEVAFRVKLGRKVHRYAQSGVRNGRKKTTWKKGRATRSKGGTV